MILKDEAILLTGGHGFLGKHVAQALIDAGCTKVSCTGRSQYDLLDRESVDRMFYRLQPSIVIHMAAILGGIGEHIHTQGKYLYENLVMGLEVMEQARLHGIKKFVTIGTSCSYPNAAPTPLSENTLWNGFPNITTAPYGIAKRVLMYQGQAYREQYGFNAISVIPANVYGPGDTFDPDKSHVIPALILKCLEAKKSGTALTVWGTGRATREFVYATDCARAITLAAERYSEPEPMNIGTGIETPIRSVVLAIAKALDFKGDIVWDSTKPDGHPGRVFDVSKAAHIGFTANVPLESGIQRTIDWYLETQCVNSNSSTVKAPRDI